MSAVNLAKVSRIYSNTAVVIANTTSVGNILFNPVNSNLLFRVSSAFGYNSNTTNNTGTLIITFTDFSSGNLTSNIFTTNLRANTNIVIFDRNNEFFMDEGDRLKVYANINNSIYVIANYDTFS